MSDVFWIPIKNFEPYGYSWCRGERWGARVTWVGGPGIGCAGRRRRFVTSVRRISGPGAEPSIRRAYADDSFCLPRMPFVWLHELIDP